MTLMAYGPKTHSRLRRLLSSGGAGGVIARRLLPAAIVVPVLLTCLRVWGQRHGYFGTAFGLTLMVAVHIITYTVLILSIALSIEGEDRKRRLAEELFRLAVNASPNCFVVADAHGKIVLANEQLEKMFLYPHDELLGQSIDVLVPPSAMASGRELRAVRRDGSEIPIEIGLNPARLDDRDFVLAAVIDLSARKTAEDRFLATFEQAAVGIAHVSLDGRWLRVNQKLCDILGYSRDELLAQSLQSITHPEDLVADLGYLGQLLAGPVEVESRERRYFRKDGSVVWINLTVSLVRTSSGAPDYFIAVVEDISRRRHAELTLLTAEAQLRSLAESNIIGIVVGDLKGNIVDANPALLKMVGYTREEVLSGRVRWTELTPPEYKELDKRAAVQLKSAGIASPWEKEYIAKDGKRIPILIGMSLLKDSGDTCVGFVLDLSAQKRLEADLREAQRMEMIGRLAGGVAHDFNNLLTPIIGYSALLLGRLSQDDPAYEDLTEIQKAGQRASVLTRQLLAFSRKQILQPKATDLNALVSETAKLLRPLLGEDVKLVLALAPSVRLVTVDAAQVEQALLNLAANARDAMPRGGAFTIETARVDLSAEYAATHAEVTPGPYTLVAISDTGIGMNKEVVSHLFEPFFTTKTRSRGTGLGLATVQGIVKQNQGHIWVYSEVGRGTTFKLYFPVTDGEADTDGQAEAPPRSAGGTETLLLVEDEEALRSLAAKVLRAKGYEVLQADNGENALALADRYKANIDLLITDVVMPGMSGREVAEQIAATRPQIKVLYMTGYAENAIVHHGVLDRGTELLEKPFTPEGLARRVRAILDGRQRANAAAVR